MPLKNACDIAEYLAASSECKAAAQADDIAAHGGKDGPLHKLSQRIKRKFDLYQYGSGYQINPFK